MKKLILTDIDDVVLDWIGGFRNFLIDKDVGIKGHMPTQWNMQEWIDHPDILALVKEFNYSNRFGQLNPVANSVRHLTNLRKKGYKIIGITSCGEGLTEKRILNLKTHFNNIFDDVICLGLGSSKDDILKSYPPSYWIEDRMENAEAGFKAGHTAILLDKPYNRQNTIYNIIRVEDWKKAYDSIMFFEEK